MDAQVARRDDPRLAELLSRFVCVRAVEMEGVDLTLFQFDYDMSWHAFFLNADRTIYGRYGTRASTGADAGVDVSLPGFVKALEGALEIHAGYPGNRASLAGKRGPRLEASEIRSFPIFRSRFAEEPPRGCAHCHHVWEAVRSVPRSAKKPLSDDLMFPFAKPDRLGITLELDERATVRAIAPGSAGEKCGLRAGDRILTMSGQPILSIADVQWCLQYAAEPCDVALEVDRGGEKRRMTLRLQAEWRRGEDISWRASSNPLRPFAWLEATPEQRRALKVKDGALCVRITNVPPNGAGARAGITPGDFLLEIDGSDKPLSETDWLSYLYQNKVRGQNVTLTILHGGERDRVKLQAP